MGGLGRAVYCPSSLHCCFGGRRCYLCDGGGNVVSGKAVSVCHKLELIMQDIVHVVTSLSSGYFCYLLAANEFLSAWDFVLLRVDSFLVFTDSPVAALSSIAVFGVICFAVFCFYRM